MALGLGEIIAAKREVISKGSTSNKVIKQEIVQRWRKNVLAGIPLYHDKLPDSVVKNDLLVKYAADVAKSQKSASVVLNNLSKVGARLHTAVFLATDYDDKLIIYSASGDQALIDELAAKNFRLGTCFDDNVFRFTAITETMETGRLCWENAGESYQDIFAQYATAAFSVNGDMSYRIHERVCQIVVAREENFSPLVRDYVNALLDVANAIIASPNQPELQIFDKTIYNKFEREGIGYLIVDTSRICIGLNKEFSRMIGRSPTEIRGSKLSDVYNDLNALADKIFLPKKPQATQSTPMIMVKKSRELLDLYVDCTPAFDGSTLNGAIFFLRPAVQLRDIANNMFSHYATFTFSDLIGQDPVFLECKKTAMRIANTDSSVLITSESGTGKELFAQAIHNASKRASNPFVAINCGAIPKELIGSELFGYEEGAFTGARKEGAMGKIEQADGGTIFLDEIGEMPLDMQTCLLRVLDSKSLTRLGSSHLRKVNIRVIAATNKDLYKCVETGSFRLDLYYRLNVINLALPPLRERKADIPLLANFYLDSIGKQLGRNMEGFSEASMKCLCSHDWPGNIRELRNVVESSINIEPSDTIEFKSLPLRLRQTYSEPIYTNTPENETPGERPRFEDAALKRVKQLMMEYNGNKSAVAKALRISRGKLYRMLIQIDNWEC